MKTKVWLSIIFVVSFFSYSSVQENQIDLQSLYLASGMNKIASQFYDNGWIDFKTDLKLKPLDIFQNHKDLFGLGNIDEMRLIAEIHDKSGTDHYRFQQYFKGIKVEGMTYSIHSKNDVSYCANGKLAPNLELEVNPKISIDEAKTSVINHPLIAKLSGKILPYVPIKNDSLVITSNLFNNSTTITNFSLVYCLKFNDTINKVVYKLLIDPIKGNVLNIQKNSRQLNLPSHLGSCQTLYYGYEPVYTYYYDAGFLCPDYYYMGPVMQGNEYFVLNVDFTEFPCSQPTPGHFWSSQNNFSTLEARQFFTAFWGIQQSQIFFADLGTNRITSNARVWIEPDIDYSYPNAEYDPDGHYFSFGGPVINKCNHMVELDIVGHEYTHAIINYLAGDLSYSGETGAIEEGLCDAFGAMIESYSQGFSSSTIYTMGLNSIQDNLYRRSLQYPNLMGGHSISDNCQQYATGQPDTYHGLYWDYRGCDGSGIHTNSTIMSHWFYLLAEGGSGVNDFNQSFNVTGIGRDAATLIIYKFIKNQYLDYGTSFSDARNATIRVACEEYGLCSNEYYQVINAWNAVGVSSSYYGIDQVALVNPSTLVCYPGGSSFNLNCLPCTGTITWNKSSNLTFVGGSTGSSVTVRPLSSSTFGPGYLYATLSTTCGNFQTATVNFWVGKFESTVVSGTSGVCPNKTYIYTALVPGGHSASYTYNWLYPSNWVKLSQSQNSITLRTPSNPNYGTVRVSITNNCGPSGYSGITAYPGYNCQGYFTLHPNPANDEVTVTIVQPETLLIEDFESIKDVEIFDPSSNNSEYTVRIYNKIGTLVESVVMSGIKFTFPLRNLRDGTYIVEVSDGKLAHREQLIINHK